MLRIALVVAFLTLLSATSRVTCAESSEGKVIHDAEYYVLAAQNAQKWNAEDKELMAKLAELNQKHGSPPNIIYILWDDQPFGSVGFPALQMNLGFKTPNLNRMAREGINFTRMYSEPACTPTRAAFLTGRTPVRHGMGVVGMPHEFSGMRGDEVTIAEVLSAAGYATAHYGKGHLGDVEESYLHNQGFDEALFTPMNQITSLYDPRGTAVNAVLGFSPELLPSDPYQLDKPGLLPQGWVQIIEGRKGELGKEWGLPNNEWYDKMDAESEKRMLAFIRSNATAGKPFFAEYWPNWLNFRRHRRKLSMEAKSPSPTCSLTPLSGSSWRNYEHLGLRKTHSSSPWRTTARWSTIRRLAGG